MIDTKVRDLLHDRAGHLQVVGDFAEVAIAGAQRVRRRRTLTAAAAATLAVAVPFGMASWDLGWDRESSVTRASESPSPAVVTLPAPTVKTATARVNTPAGPMPLPYIQASLLHLGGRTVSLPVGQDDQLRLFATLSNGGVVYQLAGPNPAAPDLDAGPLMFLDQEGQVVTQQHGVAQADVVGLGDRVTGVAESGEFVVFDATGAVLRRLSSLGAFQATSRAAELGPDLVANLAGDEEPTTRVGSLATGRSAYIDASEGRMGAQGEERPLTLHDDRTLLVDGMAQPSQDKNGCKYLYNYGTGEQVRSWCDDTHPIGFSPDGTWMYGEYRGRPGVWVARTDDGARLLEIRTDDATQDRFTGEYAAPSPDGTALLVVVAAQDGRTVSSSCAIATGACQVVSDGLDAPTTGWLALPDNWGRQETKGARTRTSTP